MVDRRAGRLRPKRLQVQLHGVPVALREGAYGDDGPDGDGDERRGGRLHHHGRAATAELRRQRDRPRTQCRRGRDQCRCERHPLQHQLCGTSVECYAPLVSHVQKNLAAIVSRIDELTSGRKVLVVLLDYWSIWLGGTYARDRGHAYVSAARMMTAQVDTAIKTTATQSGSAYVSEREAFRGPSFGYIESHYLASTASTPTPPATRPLRLPPRPRSRTPSTSNPIRPS